MFDFLKRVLGLQKEKSKLQLLLEALSRGKIAIAIDPRDLFMLNLFELCIPKEHLEGVLNPNLNPIDRIRKTISYILNLPEKIDCKIELSHQNNVYIPITLQRNDILRSLLNFLKIQIFTIERLSDALWQFTLMEIDKIISKYLINTPDLTIDENTLNGEISSSIHKIKAGLKIKIRRLNVYSQRDNLRSILVSWILDTAYHILMYLCTQSTRLFEEKSRLFEDSIRIYTIKLYGPNNRFVIENVIQEYYNMLENLRKTCIRDNKPRMLDDLYSLLTETEKLLKD